MNRMPVLVSAMLVGVVVAVVDLFTGWTVKGGAAALVVVLGLLLGAMALFVLMVIAVIRDRRFIVAHSSDARWVLARAARGVRWASLLALGFCVLVFTNCSGGINSGGPTTSGPISDPAEFWRLTAAVLGPLLVALLLPLILTSAAAMTVDRRPHAARTLGRLAIWSTCWLASPRW